MQWNPNPTIWPERMTWWARGTFWIFFQSSSGSTLSAGNGCVISMNLKPCEMRNWRLWGAESSQCFWSKSLKWSISFEKSIASRNFDRTRGVFLQKQTWKFTPSCNDTRIAICILTLDRRCILALLWDGNATCYRPRTGALVEAMRGERRRDRCCPPGPIAACEGLKQRSF